MHHFKDFKSFADASIDLSRPLTVLIGKNGSGKSNAIEGVELLAQLAHGRLLYDIADVGRGSGLFEIRGGLQGCPRWPEPSFTLGFSSSISKKTVFYEIEIQTLPEARITAERCVVGRNGRKTDILPATLLSDRSALSQFARLREFSIGELVSTLRDDLRTFFAFDPTPGLMRNYERIGNYVMTRAGSNLSAVLYSLKKGGARGREALSRILGRIQQLPEEPYSGFDFVTTDLNDVIFGLKATRQGPLLDARILSDGTLRCLAVLTALETVEPGSRIIIEEFDNGLHPSRVGVLTQAIWDCAHRRNLNVLVTTHNPATLDALTEEQLTGVVLCFWDKKQKASRLLPLLDLPRADVLLERGHLGDLVTKRIIDQHLAPGFEQTQKKKTAEWLKALP